MERPDFSADTSRSSSTAGEEMAGDQSYDYRRFAADYAKGGEKARRLFATVSAALGAGALAYTEVSDPFGPLKSTPKACKIGSAQTLARPSGSASPNLPSASLRCIPASPDASHLRATNKFPFPVSRLLPAAPNHGVFESQSHRGCFGVVSLRSLSVEQWTPRRSRQ